MGLGAVALTAMVALAALSLPAPVAAGSITAGETRVESEDPRSIMFRVSVEAESSLEAATFNYKVLNPDGNVGGGGEADFVPANQTDATFTLETITATRYIPVGSEFVVSWELTDGDGTTVVTEEESFIFLDGQYDWTSRTEGDVTVYWYGGNESAAMITFEATRAALAETEELLEVEVPYPVRVLVWASEDDGELARQPRSETLDEELITMGQRVAADVLFVFEPDVDVVRHEAAHIVTKVAGDGPFNDAPSWLDEGTAVYMQINRGNFGDAIESAIELQVPLDLRSIQSPPNQARFNNLFYGQSWSTVDYMIAEFGEEAFAEVFRTIKEGSSTDDALESVYGVNQDGLYNLWREANGMDALDFAERPGSDAGPVAEATRAPLAIPTSVAAAPSGGSSSGADDGSTSDGGTSDGDDASAGVGDDDANSAAGLIVAVVTLLVVVALGGGAFALFRRGRA